MSIQHIPGWGRNRGYVRLHGGKREDDVAEAYAKAAKLKPHDAMEALDAAWAREQIE